jgi:hypothetical protein
MERVYLAAAYKQHGMVEEIAKSIRDAGHKVVSTWHSPSASGAGYDTATETILRDEAHNGYCDMDEATAFMALEFLDQDGSRGGRHFEYGYCKARGIPCAVVCVGEEPLNLYQKQEVRFSPSIENMKAWLDAMGSGKCTPVRIKEKCSSLAAMLLEKNRSYGDSALHPVGIFAKGRASDLLHVRIDDKLNRIRNAPDAFGEDVVQDLIGYLVLLQLAREDEKK